MALEKTPKKSLQMVVNATNNELQYFDWTGSSGSTGIQAPLISGTPTRIIEQHISDCSTSESDDNEAKENRLGLLKNLGVKKSYRRHTGTKLLNLNRNNRSLDESTRTVLSPRKVNNQQREQIERNHSFDETTIICPITPPRQLISEQNRHTQIIIDSTSPVACANKETKASELDLLIELIGQHNDEQIVSTSKKLKKPKAKRCRKDSYVAQFRRTMLRARMDQRFLDNSRLMGISAGVELLVTSISESLGVYKAKVILVDSTQIDSLPSFSIILNENISKLVTVGSRLEAFFDNPPVQLEDETVFLQPLKLFLK